MKDCGVVQILSEFSRSRTMRMGRNLKVSCGHPTTEQWGFLTTSKLRMTEIRSHIRCDGWAGGSSHLECGCKMVCACACTRACMHLSAYVCGRAMANSTDVTGSQACPSPNGPRLCVPMSHHSHLPPGTQQVGPADRCPWHGGLRGNSPSWLGSPLETQMVCIGVGTIHLAAWAKPKNLPSTEKKNIFH